MMLSTCFFLAFIHILLVLFVNIGLFLASYSVEHREEQQLVSRVSRYQDHTAFTELHSQYFSRIFEFILFKIPQREDAEDLANQVFLNIWEYLTKKPQRQVLSFRAFLYKAARNAVADFYRKQGRKSEVVELDDPEELLEIADQGDDSLEKQLQEQDADYLIQCVQKLREPYREIIALRFFEELSIKEIAEIIDKTEGNTRVFIHKGIKALRAIMRASPIQKENQRLL